MNKELLRKLPKVDSLLEEQNIKILMNKYSRNEITDGIRETLDYYREQILSSKLNDVNKEEVVSDIIKKIETKYKGLINVINATGIIIHTNLGRSILGESSAKAIYEMSKGYCNLEYDIKNGTRGSRYDHVEDLIKKITGAEAAMVVNNNAAAVLLVLSTLAKEKEVIVSRGQLVEIGGSFRIPEVMKLSGAELVEVGTTNKTHVYDYEEAINENTGVLMRVHTSNFKILGYTEEVLPEELVKLGNERDIPVVEDIGSGVLIDFSKYGFNHEPLVQDSIKKGVDIVTFSGDKMLGGPQAGIIIGKKKYIDMCKKNQLTRALRIDKTTLMALHETLKLYLDEERAVKAIPTLYMILSSKEIHKKRAMKLKSQLKSLCDSFDIAVKEDYSMVGGGSMPEQKIETYVLKINSEKYSSSYLEEYLRNYNIPIITRVNKDDVLMDLRTILDSDFVVIKEALSTLA